MMATAPISAITPARKFRMLLHINPTRQRGKRTGSLARASGWYMTFFAAGVITSRLLPLDDSLAEGTMEQVMQLQTNLPSVSRGPET
jgi:hypothetical protein